MKPQSPGGLSKLIVDSTKDPTQHEVIQDPNVMDQHLLEYCKKHFGQAHGTPYMVPPLAPLLGYSRLTQFGQQVLHGTADLDKLSLSHHTKLLLRHQQYCTPLTQPMYQQMPYEQLMQGFCKWKECTSTSLSGRHLGIYKALLKDENREQPRERKTNLTMRPDTEGPNTDTPPVNGSDVMHLIHKMLILAIRHCHTFKRWTKIWNFFIEKDIGNPHIQ